MALLTLHGASLSFSDFPLLDHAELTIERGERLCLVGRNGAGKSTLMKVIASELPLDDGRLVLQQDLKVTRLEQDPPASSEITVFDYAAEGLAGVGELLKQYHHVSHALAHDPSDANIRTMSQLQEQLDYQNGWQYETRINQVLTLLDLDPDVTLDSLSGGWLRKVALARALACDPDLLLLDEPTNHLDMDSREVLEDALADFGGTIITVSHDRYFINRVADKVLEISAEGSKLYLGDYDYYLEKKAEEAEIATLLATENELVSEQVAPSSYQASKDDQKWRRKLTREISALDERLQAFDVTIAELHEQMVVSSEDFVKLGDLQKELDAVMAEKEAVEELWLEKSEELGE